MTSHLSLIKYSSVHPDADADGDEIGRGTGTFLDVYNRKCWYVNRCF